MSCYFYITRLVSKNFEFITLLFSTHMYLYCVSLQGRKIAILGALPIYFTFISKAPTIHIDIE